MPEFEQNVDGAANDGTKQNLDDSATVQLELDESKAHLINVNGGAGGDRDDLKTKIIDPASSDGGDIAFNGLGKEEVMRYANDPFWVRLRWILFILFWVGWLAMLVTAVVIIVLAPRCPPRPDLKWYQTETVYQVLPKSFKDSNNDGVGDFEGLKDKLSYITDLGIKAIWIKSFYKTDNPLSSLSVKDHKAIDESFGVSLEDFKGWLRKLRKEGLKVILDLIPNQTSKNHTWFQQSQKNADDKYKNYYIWDDGAGPTTPPNDWKRADGSNAWTFDSTRNSWYFHQFSADYPDLNLTNEHVIEEIKDIMKFWLESGVSGFYVEGVEYLVENSNLNTANDNNEQTINYVGTYSLLEQLRSVANSYSDKPGRERLLFATVEHANKNQTLELFGSDEHKRLHIVAPLLKNLDEKCLADCIKNKIDDTLTDKEYQWLGIQLGNENVPRIASRLESSLGGLDNHLVIAYTLQLLLPGTPLNYYGDEFGQKNGNATLLSAPELYRTPMQWSSEENAGFTGKGVKPWLPVGSNYVTDNVHANLAHYADETPFNFFQNLIELRTNASFQWGKTQVCTPKDDLLLFSRKATRFPHYLVAINTAKTKTHVTETEVQCLESKGSGKTVFRSKNNKNLEELDLKTRGFMLDSFEVIVIKFAADD